MKKLLSVLIVLILTAALAACGKSDNHKESAGDKTPENNETRIYHSETGDVKVPANPKRVVVLASSYTGHFLKLGIKPVGITQWETQNKFFEGKLDGAEVVTSDSLDKILELKPDLIVAFSHEKNIDKLSKIAPTVVYTYDKYGYLDIFREIGKLVGKEKEAEKWIDEWNKKTKEAAEKVKEAIGEDATVTVLEPYGKDLYIYGNNWGRGTEILYQALGLKAPEKVEKDAFGTGYKAISAEVIPEYAGDFIFLGDGGNNPDTSFMESDVWKNIPAVKENRVISFDSKSFYFNDPISLEKELDYIVEQLTKYKK